MNPTTTDLEVTALSTLAERTLSPFARLTLGDEHTVAFYRIVSDDDREGTGLLVSTPPGRSLITVLPDLETLSPSAIFRALAPAGEPVPAELDGGYVRSKGNRSQGWARELFAEADTEETGAPALESAAQPGPAASTSACARALYLESLLSFGWAHGDTGRSGEIIEMNVGPSQNPWSWTPPSAGQDHDSPLWAHELAVHNVDLFYTRVTVCDFGDHAWGPYDKLGPYVIFRYRPAGNVGYKFASVAIADTVGQSYSWIFYSGANWDWTTFLGYSAPGDRFNQTVVWGSTGA